MNSTARLLQEQQTDFKQPATRRNIRRQAHDMYRPAGPLSHDPPGWLGVQIPGKFSRSAIALIDEAIRLAEPSR